MIVIGNNQVYSDADKIVHRLNTESYFKHAIALPTDTPELFEEVDEVPKFTKAEYDAKVAELVRERYSESEEFAIQRKYLNALNEESESAVVEFKTYNEYVEECKRIAKDPGLYATVNREQ